MDKMNNAIICAANKTQCGRVIKGHRHFDSHMVFQYEFHNIAQSAFDEQGFVDMHGNFLTRSEAMKVIIKTGQQFDLKRNGGSDKILFSEGIY